MAKGYKYNIRPRRGGINYLESFEPDRVKIRKKERPVPIEEPGLQPSEDYFESVALKQAIWQYLIDHAKLVEDGVLGVHTMIPANQDAFWIRIMARKSGRFKRVEQYDFEQKSAKRLADIKRIKSEKAEYTRRGAMINRLKNEGTIRQKLVTRVIIKFRKWASKLEKTIIKD